MHNYGPSSLSADPSYWAYLTPQERSVIGEQRRDPKTSRSAAAAAARPSYWAYLTPHERLVIDEQRKPPRPTGSIRDLRATNRRRAMPVFGSKSSGVISADRDDEPSLIRDDQLPTIVTFLDLDPDELTDVTVEMAREQTVVCRPRESVRGRVTWIELVKKFSEHLTDEEIMVLREQLS